MKYRTKPCEIEAVKFTRNSFYTEVTSFCGESLYSTITIERCPNGKAYFFVSTSGGVIKATEGDYIIKDSQGDFHLCKPDVFEKKYEAIE